MVEAAGIEAVHAVWTIVDRTGILLDTSGHKNDAKSMLYNCSEGRINLLAHLTYAPERGYF
jgi:hypothetical protein